jgi:(1->4)-alpha-D-glucan 1-alpha-D-glucosylmutase
MTSNAPPFVSATYRVQLRNGFGLDDAAAIVPYVADLGASHIYLAPIWTAAPGSTHGYDVCDPNEIDPVIGGRVAFDRLAAAAAKAGLGLILDIVPNHMAAAPENPWWADVLAWGSASRFAGHFDIDWRAEKLLLPILGTPYEQTLEAGDFSAVRVPGGFALNLYGRHLPLTPPSWAQILAAGRPDMADTALVLATATPDTGDLLAELVAGLDLTAVDTALAALNADPAARHRLHEAQPWRLTHWRMAREVLSYRRFFEVTELVGVRVERKPVFDDVHRLTLELIEAGAVQGLRVDHVDGLADPAAYLARLRGAVGPAVPVWVEKIIHRGEALKPDWPTEGTTGYEFIADMAALMTDPAGEAGLTAGWDGATGPAPDYAARVDAAKHFILTHNLAAELDILTAMAVDVARRQLATRDLGRDTLRRAIVEIARHLPRYRTYVSVTGVDDEDRALIADVAAAARATREIDNEIGVDFIAALLTLDFPDPQDRAVALHFATRFQQVTGPVTAKAVEDTVFYRFNRLIGLNEVGGEPEHFGADPAAVHAALAARTRAAPHALNAGTTHDTKRGEDARARLYALSLAPAWWAADVTRLGALSAPFWSGARHPDMEWQVFQAMLGVWPAGAETAPDDLAERLCGFLTKAMREAKAATSWTQIDDAYEAEVVHFARTALDPAQGAAFQATFATSAAPFIRAGERIGLAQHALRLLAPGTPDVYQGSEGGDFSLVDPDNRRPIDYAALQAGLDGYGARKQALTRAVLGFRREHPQLFAEGVCVALPVSSPNAAFGLARIGEGIGIAVIAPIRDAIAESCGLRAVAERPALTATLPQGATGLRNVVTGAAVTADGAELSIDEGADPVVVHFSLSGARRTK